MKYMKTMNSTTKKEVISRFKSLLWRTGSFLAVGMIAIIIDPEILSSIDMPVYAGGLIALIGAEVTKYLNSKS